MRQTENDLFYLLDCTIQNQKPEKQRVESMDLEQLYQLCQFHNLTAMVGYELELAGVSNPKFVQAKAKAIRKNFLMDAESEKLRAYLEQSGIWYMPMKGILLREFYPKPELRQMSDHDILYDKTYQKQLLHYMKQQGYHVEEVGKCYHDAYTKPPVYRFEMHTALLERANPMYAYYETVRERLLPVEGKSYEYRFSDSDFYLFLVIHAYKHFIDAGAGIRMLLDFGFYLRQKQSALDWTYLQTELESLGICAFEEQLRSTAQKLMENPTAWTAAEQALVETMLRSGTYGTVEEKVRRHMEPGKSADSKSYLLRRIFPDREFYRRYYPTAAKYPVLIPFAWCFRLVRAGTVRRKQYAIEIGAAKRVTEQERQMQAHGTI